MNDRPKSYPDALAHILDSVRLESAVFSRASLGSPWGVESGEFSTGVFHAVVTGQMYARLEGSNESVHIPQGDVVFIPHGHNHLLGSHPDATTRRIEDLTTTDRSGMGQLVVSGMAPTTTLLCGTISYEAGSTHPIFSMMPPLLHITDGDGRLSHTVQLLIGLISAELDQRQPGAETVVARLTDVLVVQMLRAYVNNIGPGEGSWLGGLTDARVAATLGHMHRDPSHPWTSIELARLAGMSRSAYFVLFKGLVGESPMEYLTRWRMHIAARLLRDHDCSVSQAAKQVGYATEAGFSNAFVRSTGVRPGTYRRGSENGSLRAGSGERQTGARLAPLSRTTAR